MIIGPREADLYTGHPVGPVTAQPPGPACRCPGVSGTPMTYLYAARSSTEAHADGTRLGLATTAPELFLAGTVERADVLATALLRIGEIAGTRFFSPVTDPRPAELADPIITSGDGVVRFESLSTCSGVAARLDLLPGATQLDVERAGTTNVDVGPHLRHLLAQVRRRDPMHVVVGPQGLGVRTLDGSVLERRVELPERWVRSLAELQVLASRMSLRLVLDQREARAFLADLPRRTAPRESFWLHRVVGGVRLGAAHRPGAVAVGGPERLRVLGGLVRHATALRVYAPEPTGGPAATWWELELPHARFGVGLSPYAARAFSGEGALLDDLAAGSPQAHLAAQGALGYDVAEGRFFARTLPFATDVLRSNPRLARARRLLDRGAVRRDGERLLVRGSATEHVVELAAGGGVDRCTCTWFADHRGSRGPCAHVLAARLHAGGAPHADADVTPGAPALDTPHARLDVGDTPGVTA
jgi:hypothetical protein